MLPPRTRTDTLGIAPLLRQACSSVSSLLSTFTDALDEHEVTWSITTVDDFEDDLNQVIEEPAVATELPFSEPVLPAHFLEEPLTTERLREARTGITGALLGVATYGSIALAHDDSDTEPVSLYATRHVAVLRAEDLVPDLNTAFAELADPIRSDRIGTVLATGPSATADMGALVYGAHGPREVHILILDDAPR